jgi:hypothetical protein
MKKSLSLILSTTMLASCYPKVGPHSLKTDSIQYNNAVQNSNDSQLLLNIVRMRYRDTPTFLQVGIISSAYEFKKSASAELDTPAGEGIFKLGVDLSEKPTVTYQPTRGEGYVKEFMAPISFEALLLLNSSGWPIDRILRCCVQRMNDLKNAPTASGPTPYYVPEFREFRELTEIFRQLEVHDGIDIVVVANPVTGKKEIVFELDPEIATEDQLRRVWELFDVEPGTMHIKFVPYHGQKRARNEVMVQTRSPISVLYFLSQAVNVPLRDEYSGLVTTTIDEHGNGFDWNEVLEGIMTIRSGSCSLPEVCQNRRIKVRYRGVEFYIDDRDLDSKATFSMISQLLALQTGCIAIPALTLPIN